MLNLVAALEKAQISSFRFDFSGNGYVYLFMMMNNTIILS
jgi:hypothetical protein